MSINVGVLPDELREEWEHFRGFGWNDQRIAAVLDVSLSAVTRTGGAGSRPRHVVAARRRGVARLVGQGKTVAEIAAELEVTQPTVQRDLGVLKLRAVPSKVRQAAAERRRDLRGRIGQLRTVAAAARFYQVHPCTIVADLEVMGISMPCRRKRGGEDAEVAC